MSSLAHRTGMQRYHAAHREEMNAARRAWYAANPEPERAKVRARYRQIRDAIQSYSTNDPESLFAVRDAA